MIRFLYFIVIPTTLIGLGVALFIFPAPVFVHRLVRSNIIFHSRLPLPDTAVPFLDEAIRRVQRSPLYSQEDSYDVFLCDSPVLFDVLSLGAKGGGITNPWGNVFIRPGDFGRDAVFDRNGRERAKDRDLSYYVAHELTHAMTFHRIGFLASRRISAFQREGYADYVGRAVAHDLTADRKALIAEPPEMKPSVSGLYLRYEVLVAYLLNRRGISVDTVLRTRLSQNETEMSFLNDPL